MFPPGLPGLALLLLRVSVAVAVLLEIYAHKPILPGWVIGAVVVLSACLCAGYLTPLAAAGGFIFHLTVWATLGVDDAGGVVIASFDAAALALLGPGAYSVDSYRFGRRVLLLPPD